MILRVLTLLLLASSAAVADGSDEATECIAAADSEVLAGGRTEVDVSGRSAGPVVGYSFAVAHDGDAVLAEVQVGPEVPAKLRFIRFDNEADCAFGSILVVLDGKAPLGDVLPLDISATTVLATLVSDALAATLPGEMISLTPENRTPGEPPVASVLVNENLDFRYRDSVRDP